MARKYEIEILIHCRKYTDMFSIYIAILSEKRSITSNLFCQSVHIQNVQKMYTDSDKNS